MLIAAAAAAVAVPMAEKEFLPTGVQLIEAGYGGRVADLAAAPVQGIVVAVVDTGMLTISQSVASRQFATDLHTSRCDVNMTRITN
jgi:hypothetical protein